MLRWIIFFAAWLATCLAGAAPLAPAMANPGLPSPVTPGAETPRINLAGHLMWLKDESGALSFDAVRARDDFVPLPDELSAGFTGAAVWLRFDVQPAVGAPTSWVLEVANALLDDVRLYVPQADDRYVESRSGEDVPRAQWPVDYRTPTFQLHFDSAEPQRFYVRIWARNAVSAKVLLWQAPAFAAATRNEAFADGIYYGIFSLILVFHLFFWRWTGEYLAGWYVPYVAINFVASAISAGYIQRLTGLSGAASDMLLGVTICMILGISNTFTLLVLELPKLMPRFTRGFLTASWAIGIATALAVLSGHFGAGVSIAQMTVLACIAIVVLIGIRLAWRGHRPARFFLLAFGIFYAAVVLRFLRNLGFLPPMPVTEYAVPITALLHMVIMSLGITGHYNKMKGEKLVAQAALNASLETQVQERTAKLVDEIAHRERSEQETRRALDAEREARREQQEFVAMVSHEFRTPLAIINTVTQQLAANLDAPRDKSLQRCANIRESARRMTDMMDEFLSLDHLGEEIRMNRRAVDPSALLRTVAEEWAPEQLQLDLHDLPPALSCDVELLRVALRNLIANAVRHSPQGAAVRLAAHAMPDNGIAITVEDQGAGIPRDEIPKLFQKYFRGRAAQTKPGAGLGLYLVERIAQLHGGSIRLENVQATGSRFVLSLPTGAASEGLLIA